MFCKTMRRFRSAHAIAFLFALLFFIPRPGTAADFQFDSLRFYEAGFDTPEEAQRIYNTEFSQNSTRYIWCLVTVKNNLYNIRNQTHHVIWRYYKPDGTFMGEMSSQFEIKSEWEYSWIPHGYGWDQPGSWDSGSYRAEVLFDGKKIGESYFTIKSDIAQGPSSSQVTYQYIKFFESGYEAPDMSLRHYTKQFPKDITRFVFFTIGLKNHLYHVRDHKPTVTGRYYKPDGTLLATVDASTTIQSDWSEAEVWQGWGWDDPGNWVPGTYRVEVTLDSKKIAEDTFTVYAGQKETIGVSENLTDVINKGVDYLDQKDPDNAIREFTKAIGMDPRSGDAYFNRGVAYSDKGNKERAVADYTKAIEINSRDSDAFYNRALLFYKKGQNDEAIRDYTKAIEIDSTKSDAFYNRGLVYHIKGEYETAVKDFTRAISIDPHYGDAFYSRGLAYDNLGEYDKAIADYTSAIEIDPTDNSAYYYRGLAYDKKGQKNQAISDYTKASVEDTGSKQKIKRKGKLRQKVYKTAVVEFSERGSLDAKDAGSIIAEWMTSSMIKTGVFEIYTRLSIEDILKEQKFQTTGFIDAETAAKAGKIHGVEAIVTGSIIKFGNTVSVTVKLIDTETARIIDSADIKAKTLDDLSEHIDELALELARE